MDNRTISQRIITAAAGLLLVLSAFAVPAKALTIDESGSLEPRRVVKLYQEVEDTYKAFSCDVAYISKYDVTYKRLITRMVLRIRGQIPSHIIRGLTRAGMVTLLCLSASTASGNPCCTLRKTVRCSDVFVRAPYRLSRHCC